MPFFHLLSDKMGSKRRSSDIISLLVSIYGSKDIFIDEYRAVLADRLLHQLNYNTARLGIKTHINCPRIPAPILLWSC